MQFRGHFSTLYLSFSQLPKVFSLLQKIHSDFIDIIIFKSLQEFTTDLFFKQAWDDPRLKHDLDYPIVLVGEQKKRFWLPDTFFYNVKTAKSHSVPSENNRIMIYPTGKIELSERQIVIIFIILLLCTVVSIVKFVATTNTIITHQRCNNFIL